jgi:hypothetical protein
MEGEFTLIFPVGLVKPFLTLTRGKRPHFVARETVTSPPPNKLEGGSKRRRVVTRGAARIQAEPVKKVRIARCTFCLSNFFTP